MTSSFSLSLLSSSIDAVLNMFATGLMIKSRLVWPYSLSMVAIGTPFLREWVGSQQKRSVTSMIISEKSLVPLILPSPPPPPPPYFVSNLQILTTSSLKASDEPVGPPRQRRGIKPLLSLLAVLPLAILRNHLILVAILEVAQALPPLLRGGLVSPRPTPIHKLLPISPPSLR